MSYRTGETAQAVRYKKCSLITALLLCFLIFTGILSAAPLFFEPFTAKLPDGREIKLYMSGDEFFNWMHDAFEYPVKKGADGYFYYLLQNDSLFSFTNYRVDLTNPWEIPSLKTITIPSNIDARRKNAFLPDSGEYKIIKPGIDAKHSGLFNNLVIYIKFSDQTDFPASRQSYDERFNSLTGVSLRTYYREVSYDKLDMVSYHMPGGSTENLCFTDINPRNYYSPYNIATNPDGYKTDDERRLREHNLLKRAAEYVNNNFQKPAGVNFDSNNDGNIDNVTFIIRGSADAWSNLLWPHRWTLYSFTVSLWNKRVYSYTFQMDNTSVKTLAHEMFHSLGAPDLYRYTNTNITPVGIWDIMGTGSGHMTSWMKYRYGGWIESIPEITRSGVYTLLPLSSSTRNSYKIKSPQSENEVFVVEYREKSGMYESNLPSGGLLITRIDDRYKGNAQGPPDELYLFRPGGTPTQNGTLNNAAFSNLHGRTAFNNTTNPYPFLQDGTPGTIFISNITYLGDSMSFRVDFNFPRDLNIERASETQINLNWSGSEGDEYLIAVSSTSETLNPASAPSFSPGDPIGNNGRIVYKGYGTSFAHTSLISDELYYYTIWTILNEAERSYSIPVTGSGRPLIFVVTQLPYHQDFVEAASMTLPRGWKAQGGEQQWGYNTTGSRPADGSLLLRNLGPAGEWLYTPGFMLSSNRKYLVSFRYKGSSTSLPRETISLNAGTNRHNPGMSQYLLFTDSKVPSEDFIICRAVFKPETAGPHYFGLKSLPGGEGLLLNDFKIEEVPINTVNLSEPMSFFPNPSRGIITIPANQKTTVTICSTGGIPLYSKVIEGTTELDISRLGSGLYLIKFDNKSGSSTARLILSVY